MGKTYHRAPDEERSGSKKPKHHAHSNNKKLGGMRVINAINEYDEHEDDDFFDDKVQIRDTIVINKFSDDKS